MIQLLAQFAEQHPGWNWFIITSTAIIAWLAPIAALVTIVLGCLNIYILVEKRWFKKDKK